jgi:hypothetical protein
MNPKFERFLKETRADQLAKERLERKQEREEAKAEKLATKENEKRLKQLAREEAKAEKLRNKLAKQEAKTLEKLEKSQSKSKKKGTTSLEKVSWQSDELFGPSSPSTNATDLNLSLNSELDTTVPSSDDVPSSEPAQNPLMDLVSTDNTHSPNSPNSPDSQSTNEKTVYADQPENGSPLEKNLQMETMINPEPKNLYQMFKAEGDYNWLKPDSLAAKGSFNLINKGLHPERYLAQGVAVLPIKGSSFGDNRVNCLKFLSEVRAGENNGEIYLKPEPQNQFDPNAVAIYDMKNDKMLGYVPKAQEINACYAKSLSEGKFCGGYIIDGKNSMLKEEENAMILIATGWI